MNTKSTVTPVEIKSLDRLMDLRFQLDYVAEKYEGRPDCLLPPDPYDRRGVWVWGINEDLDFWDFDISINNYKILNVTENDYKIEYSSALTDIYASLGEEIENLIEKNADQKANNLFLLKTKKILEQFRNRYYDIHIIDDDMLPLNGIWHNSIELVPNDKKKHLPDIAYIKAIISTFLKQQKQFIDKALILIDDFTEMIKVESMTSQSKMVGLQNTLQWKKSDTDLLELIVALNESGSIFSNNTAMTRKQTIEFFEILFGKSLKDAESKLSRATERKDKSPYLSFLKQTFENYSDNKNQ
jgi:hypothetical protein